MSSIDWQPTASLSLLKARAELLFRVRGFFKDLNVLEVDTPLLSAAIGTDLHIDPLALAVNQRTMFLQTSPEFAMKRLLASGSGSIFQICKAFRNGEAGTKHNPEFTMLEWYREGFSIFDLMDEIEVLIKTVLPLQGYPSTLEGIAFTRISYKALFQRHLGLDPHQVTLQEIKAIVQSRIECEFDFESKEVWLDLAFSHLIEPELTVPTYIYYYPKSQAALACIIKDEQGVEVAQRFELVINGMELANGYFELRDSKEQLRRFNHEQEQKKKLGLITFPVDEKLLAALHHGFPKCSGVALGIDRLLMLATASDTISEVLSFDIDNA